MSLSAFALLAAFALGPTASAEKPRLDPRLQKMAERHAEPGWQDSWTLRLSLGIGGYVGTGPKGATPWNEIRMDEGLARQFCPSYNRMKPSDKRDFLIELFKAVSWAESSWQPSAGRAPGPQGLFQMSASDMQSCAAGTRSAAKAERIRPDPNSPPDAIGCAVFKLMPVFYRANTFATATYTDNSGQTLNNHFEVLYPKWPSPSGLNPNLHAKLKARVTRQAVPACFAGD